MCQVRRTPKVDAEGILECFEDSAASAQVAIRFGNALGHQCILEAVGEAVSSVSGPETNRGTPKAA
jgi:hypothetical protein